MLRSTLIALVGTLLVSVGCKTLPGAAVAPGAGPMTADAQLVIDACYGAVDDLLSQHADRADLDRVLVATVVDVNDVDRTTMFGRVATECFSARLTQNDIDVITATVREDRLVIADSGQFLLSRDDSELADDFNARTALVSTYARLKDSVIVSLKLVSTVENSTLAAVDFVLPNNAAVDEMLFTSTYWRYPY